MHCAVFGLVARGRGDACTHVSGMYSCHPGCFLPFVLEPNDSCRNGALGTYESDQNCACSRQTKPSTSMELLVPQQAMVDPQECNVQTRNPSSMDLRVPLNQSDISRAPCLQTRHSNSMDLRALQQTRVDPLVLETSRAGGLPSVLSNPMLSETQVRAVTLDADKPLSYPHHYSVASGSRPPFLLILT